MLVGLGPFRFTIPTFAVDELSIQSSGRVASPEVVGGKPPTHILGANARTISLRSTFHPHHLNKAGGVMLSAVHVACEMQQPLMLISLVGRVFGRYIIVSVGEGDTLITALGAQTVTADISLQEYIGSSSPASVRVGLF